MLGNIPRVPCRNGPNCFFKRQGNCWFYHPPSHDNHNLFNFYESRPITIPPRSIWFHQDSYNNSEQQEPSFSYRAMRLYNEHLKILRNFENKQDNLDSIENEKKQMILHGKPIKLLKFKSNLSKEKSWFFENSHHFNFFQQCQYKNCSICLLEYEESSMISSLLCNHAYHTNCISQWFQTSALCPLCKQDFRIHQQFKEMKGYVKPKPANATSMLLSYRGIEVSDDEFQDVFDQNGLQISISEDSDFMDEDCEDVQIDEIDFFNQQQQW